MFVVAIVELFHHQGWYDFYFVKMSCMFVYGMKSFCKVSSRNYWLHLDNLDRFGYGFE